MPAPVLFNCYSVYHRLTEYLMFHPIFDRENQLAYAYIIFLNATVALLTVNHTNMATFHSTIHVYIALACTLTCTFAWLQSSDNRGLDRTVVKLQAGKLLLALRATYAVVITESIQTI